VESSQAAFPGSNGRVAFAVQTWRLPEPCQPTPHGCEPEVASSGIETVRPSGGGRTVVRAFAAEQGIGESGPAWSPSGRLLTFPLGSRLAVMRSDGTGLRRLPQLTGGDAEPTWSPDGRRLAFSGRNPGRNWLYTVRRDGTALRRVMAQEARWPAWSTLGTIAFVNYDDRARRSVGLADGTYGVRPDGSRLRRLFRRSWGPGQQPDWSPDGSRIAFVARRHIYAMRADGRRLRRVTGHAGDSDPAWSPDGRYLAFVREHDVYVVRADGRGLRRVVDGADQDLEDPERPWEQLSAPSWQPLRR
jgi:Tol biopolymer transport system component